MPHPYFTTVLVFYNTFYKHFLFTFNKHEYEICLLNHQFDNNNNLTTNVVYPGVYFVALIKI